NRRTFLLLFFKDLTIQESVQPSRLSGRPWKAVQNKTVPTIGLPQPVRHQVIQQVVRNEFASIHDNLGLPAKIGSRPNVLPKKVAGRYLRDTVALDDLLRLCTLACSRRSQQDHRTDIPSGFFGHHKWPLYSNFPSRKDRPLPRHKSPVLSCPFSVLRKI